MFYFIYQFFHHYFSPFNVFQYITFRTAGALLTSLFLTYLITLPFIKKMTSYKIKQNIRTDGPQTHLTKSSTPTMGGIIILISLLLSTILWARLDNRFIIVCLIGTIYLGMLGFLDDYLKHKGANTKGLSSKKKFIGQLIFAAGLSTYLYFFPSSSEFRNVIDIPYAKDLVINVGIFYIFFSMFIIVGSSNAVNLTDGLDGLAVGSIIFCSMTYMILSYVAGNIKFSAYLKVIYVPGCGELVIFLASLIGACLGFLWYNTYPAEIFMGDTGSLFLGGTIGMVALIIKQEILLIIAGGVFVAEAMSVILQVASFKLNKKRIFKMAPLHHHFELSGWSEPKVVIRFWIIAIMLSLVALSSLKIR
jgi:phospho-N-acetylmuramoyl-pentapeptide-transferase